MFALIVLLLSIASRHRPASAAVEVKTSRFPSRALAFQDLSFENTTLYYALCDQTRDQPEKQCTLVRELIAYDDVTETRYCDVKLATDARDTLIGDGLMVIAFGNDKAIIVWLEESDKSKLANLEQKAFLRMSVVHVADCRVSEAKLEFDRNELNIQWYPNYMDIITFKDSFDLVAKNLRVCGEISHDGHCMFTFDDEGKKISGPVVRFDPLFKQDYFVSGVEPNTFDNGYLLFNNDGSRQNVYLVRPKNSEMAKLWESPAFYKGQVSTSYSIINKAIGVCCLGNSSNNWIFSCWQSQYQGKHLLQTKFDFEPQTDVTVLGTLMYNLRGGGFLLMSTVCPSSLDCLGVENVYYLTKVDAHDGVAGTIEVDGYKGKCGKTAAQLFENQAGDYCLAVLCPSSSHVTGRLDVITQCYSDDDFTK